MTDPEPPADPEPAAGAAHVLALDLGSSSVRAVRCDERGRPVPGAIARREVDPHQGDDGRAELDPDRYVGELAACLDELAERGLLDGVGAVATSSQWHSVLAVDGHGRPASPVLTWLDTRARPQREPADPERFHARTGTWPHTLYWTAKVPYLAGELGATARSFRGLPDHVRAVLLGDPTTSLSMASGTGLLDLDGGRWDEEAVAIAGVTADRLPPISDRPGRLAGEFRRRWPALADVPWQPVLGDGAASNLGTGCDSADRVAVTVGTSAALRVVHPAAGAAPPAWPVWRYRVDEDRMVSGIAFSGGGVLHAWTAGLLQLLDDAEPDGVVPGEHGLVCLPLHAGSRPPETIRPGSGALVGLSLDTTAPEVVAATMEGVALEIARALDELERSFDTRFEVVLGGGGTASEWWQGAFAAIFDRDIRVADDPEVGARGAAAHALGCRVPVPETVRRPGRTGGVDIAELRRRYERIRTALLS